MMNTRRKRMPHARWVELIREQESSGLSVEAFCQERDLGVHSFRHHLSRMQKCDGESGGFVQVNTSGGSGLRLLGGGWVLELEREFDAETLRRFLAVAGR